MKKTFLIALILAIFMPFLAPTKSEAATLADRLSGRIVLDVEGKSDVWYIEPTEKVRYSFNNPAEAKQIISQFGMGISEKNFQKIAQSGTAAAGDLVLARKLSGKIIIRVEKRGEAWYVNPANLKKYFLGAPSDAVAVMRRLGLGVKKTDLAQIPKAHRDDAANAFSSYKYRQKITTDKGVFYADIVEIGLSTMRVKVLTDTAGVEKCSVNCPAKTLKDYAVNNRAFAAINGSYFNVGAKKNYFFAPIYNSLAKRLINEDQLKYPTTGPVIAFDENNNFYYYKSSSEFVSVSNFEKIAGAKLSAAFSNKPRLIENRALVLKNTDLTYEQRTARSWRSAFGYTKAGINPQGTVYLVSVRNATVPELAAVMKNLGMDYALNLDGGASTAVYYNNEYKIGPGRNIPNAILFAEK